MTRWWLSRSLRAAFGRRVAGKRACGRAVFAEQQRVVHDVVRRQQIAVCSQRLDQQPPRRRRQHDLVAIHVSQEVFILERHKKTYNEADIRARISVIFFSNIILGIMSILSVLPVMTWIRDMFYRHRDAGMYDSASIGVALGTAESAFICISSGLFCVVFLASSGIGFGVERLVGFWGFFTFNSALFSYFGQLFVSAVKSLKTATILCGIYIGINNLFAGLIIPPQEMTTGFYSITYYITPGHYIFEGEITALMYNDLRKVKALDDGDFYQWLVNRGTCMDGQVDPCVGTQEEYVKYFFGGEFTEDNTARNVIILGIVLFIARFLTWVALKYIRFSQ